MKQCTVCNYEGPASDFPPRRRVCKPCFRQKSAEANRRYREAQSDPEAFRERRNAANRRYYRLHPAPGRASTKRWKAANSERWAEYQRVVANQRRAKMSVGPTETGEAHDYRRILGADPCGYCGGQVGDIDHIVPIAANGLEEWTNLTAACASCNRSKGARLLLIWMASR